MLFLWGAALLHHPGSGGVGLRAGHFDGVGQGQDRNRIYVRQRHEYLLLGKRGQPITAGYKPRDQGDKVGEAEKLH